MTSNFGNSLLWKHLVWAKFQQSMFVRVFPIRRNVHMVLDHCYLFGSCCYIAKTKPEICWRLLLFDANKEEQEHSKQFARKWFKCSIHLTRIFVYPHNKKFKIYLSREHTSQAHTHIFYTCHMHVIMYIIWWFTMRFYIISIYKIFVYNI